MIPFAGLQGVLGPIARPDSPVGNDSAFLEGIRCCRLVLHCHVNGGDEELGRGGVRLHGGKFVVGCQSGWLIAVGELGLCQNIQNVWVAGVGALKFLGEGKCLLFFTYA